MRQILFVLILFPALGWAATPSEGVELKVRRGFFTETDIGTFFTLGGNDQYSNAQAYFQLGIGYDLGQRVTVGAHFGLGANAANCFAGRVRDVCSQPDNFTVMFTDFTAGYMFQLAQRFYLMPKLAGGWTFLQPGPVLQSDNTPLTSAPNFGGGLGVEYATHMDHFSIGVDVLARMIGGPNILTMSIFPRVKYTF